MMIRHALLTALITTVLTASQGSAHAACPVAGIHLTVRVEVPRFGDRNDLIYRVDVANLGPDRATGVVARQSTLLCAAASTPLSSCQRIPPTTFLLADLGPGGRSAFPAVVLLPTEDAVVVRTTVEVVRAEQHDAFSVLGGCQDGRHPQDACGTNVFQVTP